jgi:hypothetical protein
MNYPDHISASLETIFWVKILKFLDSDHLGFGMEKILFREPGWKKFGSGINISDLQHCLIWMKKNSAF